MANTQIALSGQPINVMLPSEAIQRGLETNAMRQRNALQELSMQEGLAAREGKKRLNALYQQSGGDFDKMLQSGDLDMDTAMQLMTAKGEQAKLQGQANKEQAQADKYRLQAGLEKLNYVAQLLAGATPENWEQIRQEFGQMTGQDLGDQYDQAKVQTLMQQGLSMKDKLANEWKAKGYDLDVAKFGEQQRHNITQEGISQQNANNYGGGGSATPNTKWKVDLDRGVKYDDAGNVEPLPGGAVQKPLTAAERAAQTKAAQERKLADKDYQNSLTAAKMAESLFEKATGSGLGKASDATQAFFGRSTEGAQASAQLKVVAGKLVAAVPKFSGPQSDADVKLYREMAGQVGDESLPVETRKAALQTVIALQTAEAERRQAAYAPEESAPAPQRTLSADDTQALEWAQANQGDPRAAAIMQKLGAR